MLNSVSPLKRARGAAHTSMDKSKMARRQCASLGLIPACGGDWRNWSLTAHLFPFHTVKSRNHAKGSNLKVFTIGDEKCKPSADGTAIKLEDLQQFVSFQRITCEVKVIDVDHAMEVAGGKKKQDLVADSTGTARSVNLHPLPVRPHSVINRSYRSTNVCE